MTITQNGPRDEFVTDHTKMQSRMIVDLRVEIDQLKAEIKRLTTAKTSQQTSQKT